MAGAEASDSSDNGTARVLLAWSVHLLTASGAVIAAVALLAVMRGDPTAAALLMLAALLIDSVDGTLARRVGVAEAVPSLDGRRLDDIVDYLNYAIVPTVFLLGIGALPHWSLGAAPILASAYGFAQHDAKTDDDFFLGWPSYWNVLAIYLWLFEVSPATSTALVLLFALAVFVPLKYVYVSKLPLWRAPTVACACAWGLLLTAAIVLPERARSLRLAELSLLFPAYYFALSGWLGGWMRRSR